MVRHLETIVWLVGTKVHDIGSSIQSVVVACDPIGFASCVVQTVVPWSSCLAFRLLQRMFLRKVYSQMSSTVNVVLHCESIAIEAVIPPKPNGAHIRYIFHVQILGHYEVLS